MQLAFMSWVCPKMTLTELLAAGKRYGYEGIEFRPECSHGHGVELSATAQQRQAIRREVEASGLVPCCIAPSVSCCQDHEPERDKHAQTLLRYIDLAAEMGIQRIRVFGDPLPNGGSGARSRSYAVQADFLARPAERAAQAGVKIVLEVHGNLRGFDVGEILYRAAYPPALWINWHLEHCLNHGEDVDEAYRHVKGRVGHAHFQLMVEKTDPFDSVFRQAQLLAGEGFDGFFSVEVINNPNSEAVMKAHADGWARIKKQLQG
jgi:sugar phosphate isomerase/epimerase